MSGDQLPEPDRIDGARHPSETPQIFGQEAAEASFLDAFNQGRLHHAWLIRGPQGVGKATLSWRIARFLLATPDDEPDGLFGDAPTKPQSLDIPDDHPVVRRMKAGSEGGLFVLRRGYDDKTKRLRSVITVDEVRKLKNFFALSATEGGRRVVIVDAADEMTSSAANALLKVLEEPPAKTTLLLVCHQPSRLLPTVRSRCRELRLPSLGPEDMKNALQGADLDLSDSSDGLVVLAEGSVGEAVRLLNLDGMKIYRALLGILKTMPKFDRQQAIALAETATGRGSEERRELLFSLINIVIARVTRAGVLDSDGSEVIAGEYELFKRLCPDSRSAQNWAKAAQAISERNQHGLAVNLDPAALILDTVFKIQQTVEG